MKIKPGAVFKHQREWEKGHQVMKDFNKNLEDGKPHTKGLP